MSPKRPNQGGALAGGPLNDKWSLLTRLRCIETQGRGHPRLVEEDRYCFNILVHGSLVTSKKSCLGEHASTKPTVSPRQKGLSSWGCRGRLPSGRSIVGKRGAYSTPARGKCDRHNLTVSNLLERFAVDRLGGEYGCAAQRLPGDARASERPSRRFGERWSHS